VKYQAEMMVNSMIAPVHESAGLGSPPEQYTQIRVESMNRVLKGTADYQKRLMKCYRRLLKMSTLDLRALYGGDFKLRKEYSNVTVDPQKWHKLSEKQRLQAIKLAYSSSVTSLVDTKPRSATDKQKAVPVEPQPQLSVPMAEACTLLSPSVPTFQAMWKKAQRLLSTHGSVTAAAGLATAWLPVRTSKHLHIL